MLILLSTIFVFANILIASVFFVVDNFRSKYLESLCKRYGVKLENGYLSKDRRYLQLPSHLPKENMLIVVQYVASLWEPLEELARFTNKVKLFDNYLEFSINIYGNTQITVKYYTHAEKYEAKCDYINPVDAYTLNKFITHVHQKMEIFAQQYEVKTKKNWFDLCKHGVFIRRVEIKNLCD